MQSDIQGYFNCLPKHHSCLLKHPEKHHYINSSNGIIILLSGMSSDVSHPAGVGFLWKEAAEMSQRLQCRVGAGSEMLSSQNLDAQDGGWMHHAMTPHQRLRHNPFSQRHGAPTGFFYNDTLNFAKALFCNCEPKRSTDKDIFAE